MGAAIADLVNRTAAAQQLLEQYEQRVADFQAMMDDQSQNPEVSVVRIRADGIFPCVESSLVGQVLEAAGVKRPPAQDVFFGKQSLPRNQLNDSKPILCGKS
mgnify:CR=1 FL=1